MQETLLRAWRHPDALAGRPVRAWLFTVARNLVVDQHRARRSRPPETGDEALAVLPADDELDRAVESWAVAEALAALRPEHREVLMEVYYRGKIGEGGGRGTRHPAGNGQIAHLLRAAGAQARAGGTGAGAMMSPASEITDVARRLRARRAGPARRRRRSRRTSPTARPAGPSSRSWPGLPAFLAKVSESDIAQAGQPPRAVLDRLLAARAETPAPGPAHARRGGGAVGRRGSAAACRGPRGPRRGPRRRRPASARSGPAARAERGRR